MRRNMLFEPFYVSPTYLAWPVAARDKSEEKLKRHAVTAELIANFAGTCLEFGDIINNLVKLSVN